MRQLVWCLAGLALLCAACGDDDPVKDTNQNEENWVFCETSGDKIFIDKEEDITALSNQSCDAIQASVSIRGELTTLAGLEKIRAIKGTLTIGPTYELTDISPLKNLEEVQSLNISQNEKLDNCQATALAAKINVSGIKVIKDNQGSAICTEFPN